MNIPQIVKEEADNLIEMHIERMKIFGFIDLYVH